MIISFLALTLLGFVLGVFWIAWWLVTDLFSGKHSASASIIRTSEAVAAERRTIHLDDQPAKPDVR